MNCSYIQASNIQVAIYDDRLEITSPGGLLPGVTIDLMKEGFSKIRNRSLANAFAYMNLVEAWGSGIPKLMQAMKEYGLREPEFIDMKLRSESIFIEVRMWSMISIVTSMTSIMTSLTPKLTSKLD